MKRWSAATTACVLAVACLSSRVAPACLKACDDTNCVQRVIRPGGQLTFTDDGACANSISFLRRLQVGASDGDGLQVSFGNLLPAKSQMLGRDQTVSAVCYYEFDNALRKPDVAPDEHVAVTIQCTDPLRACTVQYQYAFACSSADSATQIVRTEPDAAEDHKRCLVCASLGDRRWLCQCWLVRVSATGAGCASAGSCECRCSKEYLIGGDHERVAFASALQPIGCSCDNFTAIPMNQVLAYNNDTSMKVELGDADDTLTIAFAVPTCISTYVPGTLTNPFHTATYKRESVIPASCMSMDACAFKCMEAFSLSLPESDMIRATPSTDQGCACPTMTALVSYDGTAAAGGGDGTTTYRWTETDAGIMLIVEKSGSDAISCLSAFKASSPRKAVAANFHAELAANSASTGLPPHPLLVALLVTLWLVL